jgi:hypothetical protein
MKLYSEPPGSHAIGSGKLRLLANLENRATSL